LRNGSKIRRGRSGRGEKMMVLRKICGCVVGEGVWEKGKGLTGEGHGHKTPGRSKREVVSLGNENSGKW